MLSTGGSAVACDFGKEQTLRPAGDNIQKIAERENPD
jgi:hypothetical protein